MNKHEVNEIVNLNSKNLDIEELERRLELAATLPGVQAAWICVSDGCEEVGPPICIVNEPPAR